jgi:hypothetical protein
MTSAWSVCCGVALLLSAAPAHAQSAWRFQITPYIWGPSLQGSIQPTSRLPRLHFDRSLDEIFDGLNLALFVNGTARYGRLVLIADASYADLSEDHRWTIPPTPITPKLDVAVDVDVKMTAATLLAGYTIVDRPDVALDLLAGARGVPRDASVDVPNSIQRLPDSFSASESWADPIIAARGRFQVAPDWSLIGYVDYGGFGIETDTTWQAAATVNYEVSNHWFVSAGYRTLAFEFEKGDFDFDMQLGGPLVGATYRF